MIFQEKFLFGETTGSIGSTSIGSSVNINEVSFDASVSDGISECLGFWDI